MKKLFIIVICLAFVTLPPCSIFGTQNTATTSTSLLQTTTQTTTQNNYDRLITEPEDGIIPVLRMIQGAAKSIDLVMYEMEDSQIENGLISAEKKAWRSAYC